MGKSDLYGPITGLFAIHALYLTTSTLLHCNQTQNTYISYNIHFKSVGGEIPRARNMDAGGGGKGCPELHVLLWVFS